MCQKNLKAVNSRSFPKASMIEKSIAHHDHLMISESGTNCPQGLGDQLPARTQWESPIALEYENGTQSPMALNYLGCRWGMPAWGILVMPAFFPCMLWHARIVVWTSCMGCPNFEKNHSCHFYHAVVLLMRFLPCEQNYSSLSESVQFLALSVPAIRSVAEQHDSSVTPA